MAVIYGGSFDSTTLVNLLNKVGPKITKEVRDAIHTEGTYLAELGALGGVEYGVTGEGISPKYLMARDTTVAARTLSTPITITGQDMNRLGFQLPAQYTGGIAIDPLLESMGKGPEAIFNYVQDLIDNLKKTMTYQINYDLLNGSGTLPTTDGVTNLVAETVTSGTLHGIARAGNTWFRNQSAASSCSTTLGFGLICIKELDTLSKNCSRGMAGGAGGLKLALMDKTVHSNLLYYGLGTNNLTQQIIVNNGAKANVAPAANIAQEPAVYIRQAKCVWDADCPEDSIRLINPDLVKVSFVKDWDVRMDGPDRAIDSFAKSYIIGCSFYHMNHNPKYTGVLYNFSA